jgi:hypothetical protein
MLKRLFFSVIAFIVFMTTVATPIQAKDELILTNKEGVMYVTTQADATATSSTTISTESGKTLRVIEKPIVPPQGYAKDVSSLINSLLSLVMVVATLLVLFFLIMGGIEWITSGGEKSKTEAARNKITSAIIGLIILASSYAILLILLRFLGFSSLTELLLFPGTINGPIATSSGGLAPLIQ